MKMKHPAITKENAFLSALAIAMRVSTELPAT